MTEYRGYGPEAGVCVTDEEALAYAAGHLEMMPEADRAVLAEWIRCGITASEWVEWFFSGCFVRTELENVDSAKGEIGR